MDNDAEEKGRIVVVGSGYTYLYSRGLIANHIKLRGIPYDSAYRIAKQLEADLISEGVDTIEEGDLFDLIRKYGMENLDPHSAHLYDVIERWHQSGNSIVILICGAPGSSTTLIGQRLAERFSIAQIISTNTVRAILQKVIAPELAPELHTKSHLAHEKLRPIQTLYREKVILGYEEHTKYVSETIEGLINRATKENLPILIRGVHLHPTFISRNILDKENVFYFMIKVPDHRLQLKRLLEVTEPNEQDQITLDFPEIRKIHDYLVDLATDEGFPVIELGEDIEETIDKITDHIIDRLEQVYMQKGELQN